METQGKGVSAKQVKISIKPKEEKPTFFIDVANQYLTEQKLCGNYEVYKTDAGRLKRFYEFVNNSNLSFPDITVNLLHKFVVFLKQAKSHNVKKGAPPKPLSERTITNHLILVRTIFNRAINAQQVSKDYYPFGANGKVSITFPASKKIGLEQDELSKLENIDLTNCSPIVNIARDIWLLEFYFAGMRITDCLLLKWPDFQSGRLYYTMSKNGEPGSVKVPEKAVLILEKYRCTQTDPTNLSSVN